MEKPAALIFSVVATCITALLLGPVSGEIFKVPPKTIPPSSGEVGMCPTDDHQRTTVASEFNNEVRKILDNYTLSIIRAARGLPESGPCSDPGWRRVAFLDMTDNSYDCPPGFHLSSYSKRTCGYPENVPAGCLSTLFSVGGSQYSRVCGRAIAYQFGYFYAFVLRTDINSLYTAGLSVTHGASNARQHIWTFAGSNAQGSPANNNQYTKCMCDGGLSTPPPYVGNDYFCESANINGNPTTALYADNPLWDGEGCVASGSHCCEFNNPPWFTKDLPSPTSDDIEVRLCVPRTGVSLDSDLALERLELYIQ